jgi:two-component system, OmpR family, response regulator MprA
MEWSEASPGRPILVVDDEEVIRDTLAEILEAQGYPVQTASNGAEALEAIQEGRPSIVVTDVHMPRMDGVELVEQLHERGYDPPIVVVTGTLRNVDEVMRHMDVDECLMKPFDINELLDLIERLRCP